MTTDQKFIRIRGAAEHNLRSIDIDIPRDQLVVITGMSGSGKSSLAFDTVFAEGQRKYMESLSAYARQFLQQMQKPNVESIDGLPPTIAIQQRSGGHNPRSTVATTTEIYDYLRLLFARCGQPRCWKIVGGNAAKPQYCGLPIARSSASQIVDTLLQQSEGTKLMIAAPVIRGKKGFHRDVLEALRKQGFVRARVNGTIIDVREALKEGGDNPLDLGRYEMHTIDAIIDRVVIRPDARQRVADSVETALKLGDGSLIAIIDQSAPTASTPAEAGPVERSEEDPDKSSTKSKWLDHRFSEKFACPEHPECSLDELEPRLFSFNSPYGACPQCDGLGVISEFDEALIVPDQTLSLAEGAIEPWRKNGRQMNMYYSRMLRKFAESMKIDLRTPFEKLPKEARHALIYGVEDEKKSKRKLTFEGVIPNLHRRYENTESDFIKERLRNYMSGTKCPSCNSARLRTEALYVFMQSGRLQVNIADITGMTIDLASGFFDDVTLTQEQRHIAEPILREIRSRLGFLSSVGLNYLTLDRTSSTLSGGEAQRIRLATQVGSGLVGVCYVLDEPTIGLHQRDNDRLIQTLRNLCDIGNTVLVVEHDEGMIHAADHVIDIGPGPGFHGGTVAAQGTVDDIIASEHSITGKFLAGERFVETPNQRRDVNESDAIVIKGARENNLKSIDVAIPLGGIVCVTGVSGSGKSTLVNDILLKAARRKLYHSRGAIGAHSRVNGLNKIDRIIEVDQSPIGRTPRSNPATYTGVFDDVRKLFAQTRESKIRGYQPGRFSFNVKGGRCEACQGQGVKKIEMHFLPDVFVECEVCKGARYNRETLEIHYRHKTIAEVLGMTVEEGVTFFDAHPRVQRMLTCLRDVGLGYIQLGQRSTTLSGGEAQRIKLASELGNNSSGHTLYVLDEPTTGLHFADVERLLHVLHSLADHDNSLIVIEHNLDVIKTADWLVDLGPEGGDRGGQVVVTGTPEQVAKHKTSYTARYLKTKLAEKPLTRRRAAATVSA